MDMIPISAELLFLVFGLVEFMKKFGLKGEKLTLLSMALGIVFGILYQLAERYEAFGEWYSVAVFGLLVGLAASGIYDFTKRLNGKVVRNLR